MSEAPVPTSNVLFSAWTHIASKCAQDNKSFMACKKHDRDPKACLEDGAVVTRCVLSVLKDLDSRCNGEFNAYAKCMHYNSNNFDNCRSEQSQFFFRVRSLSITCRYTIMC
mmetsp:Transcript_10224/g.13955  ORF Transcript_10224/g.13955 Transcript_10224/m.13955 type:complete len:111 (-) Transcript_10224:464-796(-)